MKQLREGKGFEMDASGRMARKRTVLNSGKSRLFKKALTSATSSGGKVPRKRLKVKSASEYPSTPAEVFRIPDSDTDDKKEVEIRGAVQIEEEESHIERPRVSRQKDRSHNVSSSDKNTREKNWLYEGRSGEFVGCDDPNNDDGGKANAPKTRRPRGVVNERYFQAMRTDAEYLDFEEAWSNEADGPNGLETDNFSSVRTFIRYSNKRRVCVYCDGTHDPGAWPSRGCYYCNSTDHVARNCKAQRLRCVRCWHRGHSASRAEECPREVVQFSVFKDFEETSSRSCVTCEGKGHFCCGEPPNAALKRWNYCWNCGDDGHTGRTCEKKLENLRRREASDRWTGHRDHSRH